MTKFAVLNKQGKETNVMSIDIGKVKSNDPLAYSYGYFQAKSGQPMSKDNDLSPEYIRGYKEYGCGNPKKPTYAVIKKDGKTFVRETKYKDGIKSMELREI